MGRYETKQTGDLGEKIARKYLENEGHILVERNFWRKYGELDLITRKNSCIHFVEVKSVSHETKADLLQSVSHETWRPEERVDSHKLHRMSRTIETWLATEKYDGEWQIDVAAVHIVPRETFATVKLIENIII